MEKIKDLLAVAVIDKVILPKTEVFVEFNNPVAIKNVMDADKNYGGLIFTAFNKKGTSEFLNVGTVCKIKSLLVHSPDKIATILCGVERAMIVETTNLEPLMVKTNSMEYICSKNDDSLKDMLTSRLKIVASYIGNQNIPFVLAKNVTKEFLTALMKEKELNTMLNLLALRLNNIDLIEFNTVNETEERFILVMSELEQIIDFHAVKERIKQRVNEKIAQNQKEYLLNEEIKAIKEELGDTEDDAKIYQDKINALLADDQIKQKLIQETKKLSRINSSYPEAAVIRNYLDYCLELPWEKQSEDNFNIKNAKQILDEDHFGIDSVKDRILEYLAVKELGGDNKGSILCLVGPPGIGKTSIAKSVARALNKKYVRMSLGGVSDEAEIRGHRKTYVGAMAGRIISAIKQAGVSNPLILLDEIDKLTSNMKGDPSSALLEVLDPEQNKTFRDNYIEIPYDLSKVLFITTANSLSGIQTALLDRMEVIEMTGYTFDEKIEIAKRYLIPKQLDENGVNVNFSDGAISDIINYYTKESGVRTLERTFGKICRKAARMILEGNSNITVNCENLEDFLGKKKFRFDKMKVQNEIGCATGLAWTVVGGETLDIEVTLMEGKGEIKLTGQLGDVMKESALTAISILRAHSNEFHIDSKIFSETDIHIHVPEGAVHKDGPSAGVTIATALLSAFTKKAVRADVAMTGEITLRGKVLPIGGLKEKLLAAYRAGISTIIIPSENEKDLSDIPQNVTDQFHIVLADKIDTVFQNSIVGS